MLAVWFARDDGGTQAALFAPLALVAMAAHAGGLAVPAFVVHGLAALPGLIIGGCNVSAEQVQQTAKKYPQSCHHRAGNSFPTARAMSSGLAVA